MPLNPLEVSLVWEWEQGPSDWQAVGLRRTARRTCATPPPATAWDQMRAALVLDGVPAVAFRSMLVYRPLT
jgi:hypothetical protein